MSTDLAKLDAKLTAAHGSEDWDLLIRLHGEAANMVASPEEKRFHLTQAWVFALVSGDQRKVEILEADLHSFGGL